ncbi:MAG: PQQ-like beta-propeller repeat protein [Pirellulaceae bacterium]|nr:PQQ-like beta-propeller repeat protein [Pirellulaceae bacterium]
MSTDKLLQHIQDQGLLPTEVLEKLRQKIKGSQTTISARSVIKTLVVNGHLTEFQGDKLRDKFGLKKSPKDKIAEPSSEQRPIQNGDQRWEEGPERASTKKGLQELPNDPLTDSPPLESQTSVGDELDPFASSGSIQPSTLTGSSLFKKKRKNQWDSPFLLIGSGSLGALVILGVIFYSLWFGGSAEKVWKEAEQHYDDQAYSHAIGSYEHFIENYSQDEKLSLARVKIALAKLRNEVTSKKDFGQALLIAQTELPKVGEEEAFPLARDELTAILPQIAKHFATAARNQTDNLTESKRLVDLAEDSMELVETSNYIPTAKRKTQLHIFEEIQNEIQIAKREISRKQTLVTTLEKMEATVNGEEPLKAYLLRRDLLRQYPELRSNPKLEATTLNVSKSFSQYVKSTDQKLFAEETSEEIPSQEIPLYTTTGESAPTIAGQLAHFVAEGVLYGIDLADGEIRWHRYVGKESDLVTEDYLLPLHRGDQADLLFSNPKTQTLSLLSATTGKTHWTHTISETISSPTLFGNEVYLTSGKNLLQIDLSTGHSGHQILFPQELASATAVTTDGQFMAQLGNHENLYLLNRQNRDCLETYYLGHSSASIQTKPIFIDNQLFVFENIDIDNSILHILTIEKKETTSEEEGQEPITTYIHPTQPPIHLRGQVVLPPNRFGSRLLVSTTAGEILVLEVHSQEQKPISIIAKYSGKGESHQQTLVYSYGQGNQLFLADTQLASYRISATDQQIKQNQVKYDNQLFLSNPRRFKDYLFHVRRNKNGEVIVTLEKEEGLKLSPIWETTLSHSIESLHLQQDENLLAITNRGLPIQFAKAHKWPTLPSSQKIIELSSIDIQKLLSYYPPLSVAASSGLLSATKSHATDYSLFLHHGIALPPRLATFVSDRGLLIPHRNGQVQFHPFEKSEKKVYPFQPSQTPRFPSSWLSWTQLSEQCRFAISDSNNRLFIVGPKTLPEPHLAILQEKEYGSSLSRLTIFQDRLLALSEGPFSQELFEINPSTLEIEERLPLSAPIVWGPLIVEDEYLLLTQDNKLQCYQKNLNLKWDLPSIRSGKIFLLQADPGLIFVALVRGDLLKIDRVTGEHIATHSLNRMLSCPPLVTDNSMYVATTSGTILKLPLPNTFF